MNTIQHCFWPFPNWFLLFCGMFGAFCNPQIGFALPLHVITPTNSYVYLSMSDTFLFFFQDTKAIFSKHVCKDYINSVPIFLLLLFLFFPFYMSMFIYVCTDVTQLFFQSVFLLLPNDIKHFLPLLCWCIFCGPKVVQFLVFNRQDKKPTRIKCYLFKSKYGSLQRVGR